MKVQPLHDRVLLKRLEEQEVKRGGIIIPDNAKDGKFSVTARVIAVGSGVRQKGGHVEDPPVKEGDHIVLPKHHGTEITYNGEPHRIINFDVIDAVIEEA